MSSAFDKNVPVSQPSYEVLADGTANPTTLTDKPMYNWMAIRAKGPNTLGDTSLLGNTVVNGYINSNDKVGTQPSGQSGPDQNNPASQGDPETSDKFVWDYPYRIISVRDVNYSPPAANSVFFNGIYNYNWQILYCNLQTPPEPINALGQGGIENVFGTTQLEMHLKLAGQIKMVESKESEPLSAFKPLQAPDNSTEYMDTGYIILQPNFNKYAQLNQYSLVYTASANIISGTFQAPNDSIIPFKAPGSDLVSSYVNYTATGGVEDGILTIAFAYKKPVAPYDEWTADTYYSLDVVVDVIMVANDNAAANVAP